MTQTGIIRIGVTNGQMPGSKKTFPEAFQLKSRLHYYSTIFDTIEVNSCFYRTPLQSTYEKWANDVPDDFQFTLKLSKDITHAKELSYEIECMEKFLETAKGTRNKKGCLLIQFPGKITVQYFSQVEQILEQIQIIDSGHSWRKAIEFRHDSWYIAETTELLNANHAAMVTHDFSRAKQAEITTDTNFVYIRFHGPTGNYRESYSEDFLDEKATLMRQLAAGGKDVYAYFNNTAGNAFENARYLQSKVNHQPTH